MNRKNTVFIILGGISILLLVLLIFNPAISSPNDTYSSYPPPMSVTSADFYSPYPPPGKKAQSIAPSQTPQKQEPSEAALLALSFIASRENINAKDLIIYADQTTEFPAMEREFQVITLIDMSPDGKIYKLAVDLENGQIYDDLSVLLEKEDQAYISKYGKLEKSLFEKLSTLQENDTVPVAVWVNGSIGDATPEQQEAIFEQLASRYPEVKVALEKSGKPMDVDDPELAEQIKAEYIALIAADVNARVEPLVSELRQLGYEVTTFEGMPSFTGTLPKWLILELSNRDSVGMIYLLAGEEVQMEE